MKRLSPGVVFPGILAATFGVLVLSACAEPNAPPHETPDLEGTITLLVGGATPSGVLVDDLQTPTTGYTRIHLVLRPSSGGRAEIFIREGNGRLVPGTAADLRVGAPVTAWVHSTERRSSPPQWDAVRVVVHALPQP